MKNSLFGSVGERLAGYCGLTRKWMNDFLGITFWVIELRTINTIALVVYSVEFIYVSYHRTSLFIIGFWKLLLEYRLYFQISPIPISIRYIGYYNKFIMLSLLKSVIIRFKKIILTTKFWQLTFHNLIWIKEIQQRDIVC